MKEFETFSRFIAVTPNKDTFDKLVAKKSQLVTISPNHTQKSPRKLPKIAKSYRNLQKLSDSSTKIKSPMTPGEGSQNHPSSS